jgi:hypothetical protein
MAVSFSLRKGNEIRAESQNDLDHHGEKKERGRSQALFW